MRALALLLAALVVASCAAAPAPAVGAPLQRHAAAPTHEMGGMTDAGSARFAMGPCEPGGPPPRAIPPGPPARWFPPAPRGRTPPPRPHPWSRDLRRRLDHPALPHADLAFQAGPPTPPN